VATLYSFYKDTGSNTPSDSDYRLELDYSYSTDYANNRSTITASLYVRLHWTNSTIVYWTINGIINIDGTNYTGYSKVMNGLSGTGRYLIGTKSVTLNHNTDGSRNCYLQGKDSDGLGTQGYTLPLPNIPRYANITGFSVDNITMNSFHFNVSADASIDYVQHSINGGAWVDSGNQTITGQVPGTTYTLKCRVRRTDSGLWTESSTINVTTVDKNKITSSTVNVNCDSSLAVTASSASGSQCDIKIELPDLGLTEVLRHTTWWDSTTRTLNTTFTAEEIQSLASHIPNSNSTKIRITAVTVVDGVDTYFDWKDGTYSVVNANPTFSNFTYEDINPNIIELTGDSQIIVKGYSNLRAIVSVANQAVAQKGATMTKYRLVVGSKQIDVNYSSSADVNLDLSAIDNNVFTVYAIDSRGNSTPKQISPAIYKDYTPISIASANVLRTGSVSEETTLTFNGAIWNDSFGNVANSIVSCTYKYKKVQDETYTDGTTPLTPILSGNTHSLSSLIAGDDGALGFTIGSSFDVQITVTDKLSTKTYDLQPLQTAKPPMDICENMGVAFGDVYDDVLGGALQVEVDNTNYKVLTTNNINIMTVTNSGRPSYTLNAWNGQIIDLNNVKASVGNKLNFDDAGDRIIVGAGVGKVLVSGKICISTDVVTTEVDASIKKNGIDCVRGYQSFPQGDNFAEFIFPPFLTNVGENDYFQLSFAPGGTGSYTILANYISTYLTIEVVE
jgi:hypothetical protein